MAEYLIIVLTLLTLNQLLIPALSNMESFLDVNDILRPNLMPSFLMLEGSQDLINITKSNTKNLSFDGTWNEAYDAMIFHRKKLNEYLCRNFIANDILTQFRRPMITDRVGRPFSLKENHPSASKRKSRADFSDTKENLLADPGSSNYRDWLSKTTTLDDIHRHYDKGDSISRMDEPEEEYEGGEITGYAMPGPGPADFHNPYTAYNQPINNNNALDESEKHEGGFDYLPHHVHFHGGDEEKHGISLPDVFEVALTALAFLSFGIFILQVIMCISMNKSPNVMQIDGTQNPDIEGIRFKRDTLNQHSTINELSKRVLQSIEVGIAAELDNGACLRKVLCENNKYSRTLDFNQKIIVPIWGLGMSWLSGRLVQNVSQTTMILESLKASALGLASADCRALYTSCDMRRMMQRNKI